MKTDKSVRISLPEKRILHGVEITKLPIGRYVRAMQFLENLPKILFGDIIPESGGMAEFILRLIESDRKTLEETLGRLILKVPEEICRFISELLRIPEERLLDPDCPEGLTLTELSEILIAFRDMNDLSDFFQNVRQLRGLTARTKNTGCKNG